MNERDVLERLDRVEAPDLWPEIERRLPGDLGPARRAGTPRRRGPVARRVVLIAAMLGLLALVFAVLGRAFLGDDGRLAPSTGLPAHGVPPGTPTAVDSLGVRVPTAVAVGRGAIWIGRVGTHIGGSQYLGEVVKISPTTGRIAASIRTLAQPLALAVGGGSVWAGLPSVQLPRHPGRFEPLLLQIDPVSRRIVRTVGLPANPIAIAVHGSSAFVSSSSSNPDEHNLTRVDPRPATPFTVRMDLGDPFQDDGSTLAFASGSLWALTPQAGGPHPRLYRIDPGTLRVLHRSELRGSWGADLVADGAVLWATTQDSSNRGLTEHLIYRIDATDGSVDAPLTFGGQMDVLGVVPRHGHTWVLLGTYDRFELAVLDASTGRPIGKPMQIRDRSGTESRWVTQVAAYHLAVSAGPNLWAFAITDRGDNRELLRLGFCSSRWIFWSTCIGVP
jgi:hypothetical protein